MGKMCVIFTSVTTLLSWILVCHTLKNHVCDHQLQVTERFWHTFTYDLSYLYRIPKKKWLSIDALLLSMDEKKHKNP